MKNFFRFTALLMFALVFIHCSGAAPGTAPPAPNPNPNPAGGGGGGGGGGQASVCDGFGGSVNVTASVYSCNSLGATSELHFDGNGSFATYTLDTIGQNATFMGNGTYAIENGQIRLKNPNVISFDTTGDGIPDPFDELSTEVVVKLGMLAGFRTVRDIAGQQVVTIECGAIGHTLDQTPLQARYGCPLINIITNGREIVYDQQPKIEFAAVDAANGSPTFGRPQPGYAFVSLQVNQNTNNDYHGIYRQSGNNICIYVPSVNTQLLAVISSGPRFPNEFLTIDDPAFRTGRAGNLQSCVIE